MSDLKKFAHVNAKIKGMYGKKMSYDDYMEIIKQSNLEGIVIKLKEKFEFLRNLSENNVIREEIEVFLKMDLINDVIKIEKVLDDNSRKILKLYMEKYKIEYIKNRYMYLMLGKKQEINKIRNLSELYKEIDELDSCRNLQEFFEFIKYTEYNEIFSKYSNEYFGPENKSLFKLENELERMYFENLYKDIKKTKENSVKDIIGKQIDLYNVLWIYRSQKYYGFSSEIKENLIQVNYKLTKQEIDRLLSGQNYEEVLGNNIYTKVLNFEGNLEEKIIKYLNALYIRKFKNDMFDISMVISYIELKEQQIKNIINIIEGVRYDINRQDIQKKIIY